MLANLLSIAASMFIVFLAVGTLAGELDSHKWWIVAWRYMRLQVLAFAALLTVFGALSATFTGLAIATSGAAICAAQLMHLRPYHLKFWTSKWVRRHARPADLRIATLNVEMDNDQHDRVAAFLADCKADIVLLIEVDDTWIDALGDALAPWPEHILAPRDDYYGMALFSRRPLRESDVHLLGKCERPAITAVVDTDDGPIRVWGLHPEPPHPGVHADRKEVYLEQASQLIAACDEPCVAMGDLNDIAWSPSTQRFMRTAKLDDPRERRGLFATFDARRWWVVWPIDHVFIDPALRCEQLAVCEGVGSDHYPVTAAVSHRTPAQLAAK